MVYLITQIIVLLLVAAAIGFVVGWLLHRPAKAESVSDAASAARAEELEAERSELVAKVASLESQLAAAVAPREVEQLDLGKTEYDILDIEGIGNAYRKRLREQGVETTGQLLEQAGDAVGRQALADQMQLPLRTVLDWASMADLMRLSGVATQFSELLQASGVDSMQELAAQDATELARRMNEVNERGQLTRAVPNAEKVAGWIAEAKSIPKALDY